MAFPLVPPIEPMLAKPLPLHEGQPRWPDLQGLRYEPKWDGFRALIFRAGDDVAVQGRMRAADAASTGKWDLTYAFPDVVELARSLPAQRFVLDCELVIITDGRLEFDSLGMRLRPRSEAGGWKIRQLATDLPAQVVAFDLLAVDDLELMGQPLATRRDRLCQLFAQPVPRMHLTPATADAQLGRGWFQALPGAGLDGVIIKAEDQPYTPGRRTMLKAKHAHTVDVVAAGWRPYARPGAAGQPVVGSILLGLYDDAGQMQLVGAAGAFTQARRAELAEFFAGYAAPADHPWVDAAGRAPGMVSRWSAGRDASWYPLRPELVCEVSYDQFHHGRFRNVAKFLRWRPDRDPASATFAQLPLPEPLDVSTVLSWR